MVDIQEFPELLHSSRNRNLALEKEEIWYAKEKNIFTGASKDFAFQI